MLANHVLDVVALAEMTLELIESLVKHRIEGGQEAMIQGREEMVEHMVAKVGEHQELRPLEITAVDNRVHLEETPVTILTIGITLVIDFRIVMRRIQTNQAEAKAGYRRHREPLAHADPNA